MLSLVRTFPISIDFWTLSVNPQLWPFVFVVFCFVSCSTLSRVHLNMRMYVRVFVVFAIQLGRCLHCYYCSLFFFCLMCFYSLLLWITCCSLHGQLQNLSCCRDNKNSNSSSSIKGKAFIVVVAITGLRFHYEQRVNFCYCPTAQAAKLRLNNWSSSAKLFLIALNFLLQLQICQFSPLSCLGFHCILFTGIISNHFQWKKKTTKRFSFRLKLSSSFFTLCSKTCAAQINGFFLQQNETFWQMRNAADNSLLQPPKHMRRGRRPAHE